MFKRKQREWTTADAPDSIAPWEMLDEAGIAAQTARLRERWPERNLIAFAQRMDRDALACFDKGADGTGKAVSVMESMDAGGAAERRYKGFGEWFDAALVEARAEE